MNETLETNKEESFVSVREIEEKINTLKKRRRGLRKFLLDEPVNFRPYYEVQLYETNIKIETLESLIRRNYHDYRIDFRKHFYS